MFFYKNTQNNLPSFIKCGILFEYFVKHPNEMPEIYQKNLETESVERCVCDYISSMTDRYAIDLFRELYVPSMWRRHL